MKALEDLPKLTAREQKMARTRATYITAIRDYRVRTGVALIDAKNAIDHPEITGMNGIDRVLDELS